MVLFESHSINKIKLNQVPWKEEETEYNYPDNEDSSSVSDNNYEDHTDDDNSLSNDKISIKMTNKRDISIGCSSKLKKAFVEICRQFYRWSLLPSSKVGKNQLVINSKHINLIAMRIKKNFICRLCRYERICKFLANTRGIKELKKNQNQKISCTLCKVQYSSECRFGYYHFF